MANMQGESGEKTLSQQFDEAYTDFKHLVEDDDSITSPSSQDLLLRTMKTLEHITVEVSSLDLFSRNENFKEIDSRRLKFLLLPHMLGTLWQLSITEDRKSICEISRVYFKDFLKRCIDYEIITQSVYINSNDDDNDDEESTTRSPKGFTPDEKRQIKIRKYKQNKELGEALAAFQNYDLKYDDDDFSVYSKEIFVTLIKLAINNSEDQLESIEMEMNLIKYHNENPDNSAPSTSSPRKSLQPFIITKDAAQKAVYGMGYPALPIMTVEELYQQRRETGEWGPPPAAGTAHDPEKDADLEARVKDLLEEQDDEVELERKRNYDEYKDDHRRGWGNRFNRS